MRGSVSKYNLDMVQHLKLINDRMAMLLDIAHFALWLFLFSSQGRRLAQLLDEDPVLMERRQQCARRLELYRAARDEIDSVSWSGSD